jgi:phosphoserine phosphatase
MPKKLMALCVLVGAAACGDDGNPAKPDAPAPTPDATVDSPPVDDPCKPIALDPAHPWAGTNAADLTAWLASRGCHSPGYDPAKKPVALFDWDNTISKNDFGDAITFWFVANNKILRPADWRDTNKFMTDAGRTALMTACDSLAAVGAPLPTSTNNACADEILSMYIDNQTTGGQPAFAGSTTTPMNSRLIEPTYAWTAQLMAGYTDAEVEQFATAAITPQLAAAEGTTQTIGTHTGLNGWLRIYDQTKDLIAVAKSQGYDVYILTASPQTVIQAFAPMAGVATDHVIGIRNTKDSAGKRTYSFEGCGGIADGNQDIIPYIAGKRCWANKAVFGDTTAKAMQRRADGQRWVFAAGDSNTDIEFLRDATYKLVVNRNKAELMCHAFLDENDSWRVNPMFILPKAKKTSAYTCSTSYANEAGVAGPVRDEAANLIPDQLEP